jgi:Tol biopolymer transport system component
MRWTTLVVLVFSCAAVAGGSAAAPSGSGAPVRNGTLVFSGVDSATSSLQLYRMSPSGKGMTQLTPGGAVWNENAAWSPNGRTIYFDSQNGQTSSRPLIYRMNRNGTGRHLADRQSANGSHIWPSPRRGGKWLAAVGFPAGGKSEIVRFRTNGSRARVLARAKKNQLVYAPDYAPRGDRLTWGLLTFNKNGQGIKRSDIVVRARGRNVTISRRSRRRLASPSWAPDGNSLVAVAGADSKRIVRIRPDGTHVRTLAKVKGGGIASVVFAPNGRKLVFVKCKGDCGDPLNHTGVGSIWVMNANGSHRHAILTQAKTGVQPAGRVDWARR